MKKPKRRYRQTGQERSGIKETDNLFMDGFNWREFNRRCDEFMRSRGFKHQPTPITLEA
jgi:hypothetical protein